MNPFFSFVAGSFAPLAALFVSGVSLDAFPLFHLGDVAAYLPSGCATAL